MSRAVAIFLIVLGAIFTFALSNGKIGSLNLQIVGVILMIAGAAGILLPLLKPARSRFSRPITRSRQDVADEGSRTLVEHTDGSQTLVEHFDADADADATADDGQQATGRREPWAESDQS